MNIHWIRRIFLRLEEIYGVRWRTVYGKEHLRPMYEIVWTNALLELTAEDIKRTLEFYRSHSDRVSVPTPIEFWLSAKGLK